MSRIFIASILFHCCDVHVNVLHRVYIHSAVSQWKRCLRSVQLPSAVVALRFAVC